MAALAATGPAGAASAPLARPWPQRRVAVIPGGAEGYPLGGELTSSGADAVVEDGDVGLGAFARLYRVHLATGTVRRGSLVFDGAQLVRAGSSLAVVERRTETVEPSGDEAPGAGARGEEIRLLRPGSAAVEKATYLPRGVVSVAPTSPTTGAVWVGEKGKVALVDVTHGRVLRTIPLPDASGRYGVSLSGRDLAAMTNAIGVRPIELYAVSLATGEVVGSRGIPGVGGYAVATPGGVWVSYRTGMLGTAELLSYPKLATLSPASARPYRLAPAPLPGTSQGMGIAVTVDGPVTFLLDVSAIACVETSTGKLLADASLPAQQSFEPIGATGAELYGLSRHSLVAIEPPAACRA